MILPLATGVALVIHILTGVSLIAGVAGLLAVGMVAFGWYWAQLIPVSRRALARRLGRAALLATAATALYDLTRLVIDGAMVLSGDPFAAWPVFGELLTGASRGSWLARGAGFLYHEVNGIGFGVAYAMLISKPGPLTGLAWGLGLELAMALLYPGWLRITALEEFLTISMIGHVAYGLSLGALSKRFLWEEHL